MTTKTEAKWEKIDSLEQLNLGDEVEYKCLGANREYRYWGKVIDIQKKRNSTEVLLVHLEGDWSLVPSSFNAYGPKNQVTRKVVAFVWPKEVGACVEASKDGCVNHYVRVEEVGNNQWVVAETGEYYATWELELISSNYKHRVIGQGL